MPKPKIGVILSGCGVQDGSEIHEAVLTLLAIDRLGAQAVCFAPDLEHEVVNHRTRQPQRGASRNVLSEAARIARGEIRELGEARAADLDAAVLPGGYGAAMNLCDFAHKGAGCAVLPALEDLLRELNRAGKPIGALCIAPVILARVFGEAKPTLTIGKDPATAKAVEAMGALHIPCPVDDVVVDTRARLVTTPAYMLADSVSAVAAGAEKLVKAVLDLCRAPDASAVRLSAQG